MTRPSTLVLLPAVSLGVVAIAMRVHNAFHYPVDWGFDATFNWGYIYHLTQSWALPPPSAGWSSGDPPLYFYLCAAVLRSISLFTGGALPLVAVPLLGTGAGLGIVALAAALVRDADPENPRRVLLACGLLLFLPAHIYMSAMVNEEIFAALLSSIALFLLARRSSARGIGLARASAVGLSSGLALLTKLSGALAVLTAVATYVLDGARRSTWRPAAARAGAVVLVATLTGGWFLIRNRIEYGFFQPFGLPAHRVMFGMPPGERSVVDYLRVPLATWTDPQLLNPDLLRSVWGSTYATVWFDGHRFFLPARSDGVRRLGTLTLLLALLPTAAFGAGLVRGTRRALRDPSGPDLPLLLLTALTFAGYAVYAWWNPWFAVLKGTSLLAMSLPFAFYASEALALWTRGRAAPLVWAVLATLVVSVALSCTYNLVFEKDRVSGLEWERGS